MDRIKTSCSKSIFHRSTIFWLDVTFPVTKNYQKIRTQQYHCLKQDTQAVKICYYNTYVTDYIKKNLCFKVCADTSRRAKTGKFQLSPEDSTLNNPEKISLWYQRFSITTKVVWGISSKVQQCWQNLFFNQILPSFTKQKYSMSSPFFQHGKCGTN